MQKRGHIESGRRAETWWGAKHPQVWPLRLGSHDCGEGRETDYHTEEPAQGR